MSPTEDVAVTSDPSEVTPKARARRHLIAEIWIVLAISLGQTAVYAVVRLLDRLTRTEALGDQTATLNPTQSARPWLDLLYQLLHIGFGLAPVALVLFFLARPDGLRSALNRIGLDARRPGRDLATGMGLAALIGIPGLALYAAGRALGLSVQIQASGLAPYWWTIPVLILAALYNALLEEVIAVAWLTDRLRKVGWTLAAVVAASALLRGTYHLYQGPAMAAGNAVMGVVFVLVYLRWKRVMPLVVAHTLLDITSFVGYALLPAELLAEWGLA